MFQEIDLLSVLTMQIQIREYDEAFEDQYVHVHNRGLQAQRLPILIKLRATMKKTTFSKHF